jgi:hypothetical protein
MKKYGTIILIAIIVIFAVYINVDEKGNYIWKAYFYPGSNSAIRGYPTISHPDNFTGTWIDYSYTGAILASQEYVNGIGHGKGVFYDDNGEIYFSRILENGKWKSSGESKGVPEKITVPWFFPQRWINRTLDRLAILDKLFKPKPAVFIGETPKEKSHNKTLKRDK